MTEATLAWINGCPAVDAQRAFLSCCGSRWWAQRMASSRPYVGSAELLAAAESAFDEMPQSDWLEALESHPRIGDLDSLRMQHAGNKQWSAGEQSGVSVADETVLQALAAGNRDYEARFGRTFIVCATGKSAGEMLEILRRRLPNDPAVEFRLASQEQRKITRLRLDKLSPL